MSKQSKLLDKLKTQLSQAHANVEDIMSGCSADDSLSSMTMQDLQLEIIRRTSFNGFNGEAIYTGLLKHRNLWKSVLLSEQDDGMLGLRDLCDDYWNADTLFIMVSSVDDAIELKDIGQREWYANDIVIEGNTVKIEFFNYLWWDSLLVK